MDEPSLHVGGKRCRPFLPPSKTSLRIKAAQFGFDPVQLADPFYAVLGNVCCSVTGDLHQLATSMCPTIGKPNVWANPVWTDQPVVSSIAVHLQDAGEALQYSFGMNASATGGVGEGHARWSATAPWAIIPCQRPEVSGLARAGIENRGTGLVHEQLG